MKKTMAVAYVAFGSNEGRRQKTIEKAVRCLSAHPRLKVRRVSSLYRTQPVGGPPQADYLNGVLELSTTLLPLQLWKALRETEKNLGRIRIRRWGPRTIDLDLLTYGKMKRRWPRLILPHPRYHQRRFVLVPFSELAPRFVHPRFGLQNRSLLRQLTSPGQRVTMVGQWKKSRFYRFKIEKKKRSLS